MSVAADLGSPLLDAAQSLRVSSVFPFWGKTFFYPRPFLAPPGHAETADPAGRKRWKSVRLVSEGALRLWLAGDAALMQQAKMLEGGFVALESELKGRPLPLDGFVKEDLSPAVTIDRVTNAATPFERRCVRINTAGGCGMYLFADLGNIPLEQFRFVLERLGERGLGGERGVGYGQFNVLDIENADAVVPGCPREKAPQFMTLSLYLPTREEVASGVLGGKAAYDTTLRGGWIHASAGTGQRRRSLRMCVEGSVFTKAGDSPGDVRDCAPASFNAHPVWRSGLAFPLWFD
jgi:CRISPR type III-A-associated RAMP protein Csm4